MKIYTESEIARILLERHRTLRGDSKYLWVKWDELTEDEKKLVNVERKLNGWPFVESCEFAAIGRK